MAVKKRTPLAARLKHSITIKTPTVTRGSAGGESTAYTVYATRRADIINKTGVEKFTGYQELNEYPVLFVVRYDSKTKDITPKMQVIHDSRTYDIESVINPYARNKWIHIHGIYRGS